MKSRLAAHRSRLGLILLAYIAFISLGLPDGLLGVAWPSMRASFARPIDSLGLLLFASMAGYLTSSFLSGRLIARLGVGGVLAASCAATGAGLIGYTLVPAWWMVVALGVVAGLGAGAIDAGLNTYVAANFGEGLMQWLHASYGIGVTLGPIIMTVGLTRLNSWRPAYDVIGTAQIALAACFLLTIAMWQSKPASAPPAPTALSASSTASTPSVRPEQITDYKTSLPETLRRPAVWLSLLLFFLYVGAEVTLGAWTYSLLTESRNIPPGVAGFWAGSYWATFTVGRIVAGLYARRVGVQALVRASLVAALAGALLLWLNPFPFASVLGVGIVGLAIAPIFPGLVSGTSDRVGPRHAANTIGMQIGAGGLGGATISAFAGVLARRTSLESIPPYVFFVFLTLLALYTLSARVNKTDVRANLGADPYG